MVSYDPIQLGLPPGGTDGQVLARSGTNGGQWIDPPSGGGASLPTAADGQTVVWDQASGQWVAADLPAGSTTTVSGTPAGPLLLGMWAPGFPTVSTVQAHEQATGARYSIVNAFRGAMGGDWVHDDVTAAAARAGYTVLVALDMGNTAAWNLASWANGSHDSYIDSALIAGARQFPDVTVVVRPWAEMNGDWSVFQPGSGKAAAGTPAEFVAAWRHVVDRVRAAGVTNIRWGFNPTTDTYDGTTQDLSTIWPGKTYVDVLLLDGYNFGNGNGFTWRSFETTYATQYARLCALDPDLPVWVAEVGSKEPTEADGSPIDTGNSKAQWITDMHAVLPQKFPRIRAVVWFSEDKHTVSANERDWRVDSSPAALHAWQAANGVSATTTSSGGTSSSSTTTVAVVSTDTIDNAPAV